MSTKTAQLITSPQHLTMRNMTAMADKLKQQGKFTEAEELYRKGIEGREDVLGPDHPETYDIVFNLAELLEFRRHFDEAEQQYNRVLLGREKMLGNTHSTTCDVAVSLGLMFNKLSRYQKAAEMFEYAYKGYFESLGKSNDKTVRAKKNWDEMLEKKKKSTVCVIC